MNVLIGPNASGKSNLLRGIALLQQGGSGDLESTIVRQGGINSIVWDNQIFKSLRWELDTDINSHDRLAPWAFGLDKTTESLAYELSLAPLPWGYTIERETLSGYREVGKGDSVRYLERKETQASLLDSHKKMIAIPPDRLKQTQTIISQTSATFSYPAISSFQHYLEGWKIYQDVTVQQDSPVRKAAVTRKSPHLSSNGDNLITVLHTLYTTEKEFKIEINDAMRAAFGREFEELEFTPAEDQRIQMRLRWKSLKSLQSAADLSDGTLRFLMLLAILLNRARGGLVAIDEPETGLHPSMFPIIGELAAEAVRSSQIIFSTHSPEFLTALGHHNPKTTVVQSVEGETKLNMLDGDDLNRWLAKYTLGELFVSGGAEALT